LSSPATTRRPRSIRNAAAAAGSQTTSTPAHAKRASGQTPSLTGHAHLYQRFTRKVDKREIPYVVAGSGGFAATPPRQGVKAPVTVGEYTLVKNPIVEFGYLTVTADFSKKTPTLTIVFNDRTNTTTHDRVRINPAKGTLS
jgi:hypothetical protein